MLSYPSNHRAIKPFVSNPDNTQKVLLFYLQMLFVIPQIHPPIQNMIQLCIVTSTKRTTCKVN